jgi:hypothetical protein
MLMDWKAARIRISASPRFQLADESRNGRGGLLVSIETRAIRTKELVSESF